jgi:hypothetical protein
MNKLLKIPYIPSSLCFSKEIETLKVHKSPLISTKVNKEQKLAKFVQRITNEYCITRKPLSNAYYVIANEAKAGFQIFKTTRTGVYLTHPDWMQEDTPLIVELSHDRFNSLLEYGPINEQVLTILLKKDHSWHLVNSQELATINITSEQDILSQLIDNPKEGHYYLSSKFKGEFLCLGYDPEQNTHLFFNENLGAYKTRTIQEVQPFKELHRDTSEIPLSQIILAQSKLFNPSLGSVEQALEKGYVIQEMTIGQFKSARESSYHYMTRDPGFSFTFPVDQKLLTEICSMITWYHSAVQKRIPDIEKTFPVKFNSMDTYTEKLRIFVNIRRYETGQAAYATDVRALKDIPDIHWPRGEASVHIDSFKSFFRIERPLLLTIENTSPMRLAVIEENARGLRKIAQIYDMDRSFLSKIEFFNDKTGLFMMSPDNIACILPPQYAVQMQDLNR